MQSPNQNQYDQNQANGKPNQIEPNPIKPKQTQTNPNKPNRTQQNPFKPNQSNPLRHHTILQKPQQPYTT